MARLIPGKIRAKACPFVNIHRLRMEGFEHEPGLGTKNPKPYQLHHNTDRLIDKRLLVASQIIHTFP
ncbi:hypothetical protein OSB04_013278 [Centaurea solstitialis]|uniref:Uncharacterized protein n=1 Tax=Centaurea solstitialis TaxID=347529 RepID=A0AA38WQI6_9ASTR|nr:hypothetical protein OSB04_013278 [Centaurea solstitialis]